MIKIAISSLAFEWSFIIFSLYDIGSVAWESSLLLYEVGDGNSNLDRTECTLNLCSSAGYSWRSSSNSIDDNDIMNECLYEISEFKNSLMP